MPYLLFPEGTSELNPPFCTIKCTLASTNNLVI